MKILKHLVHPVQSHRGNSYGSSIERRGAAESINRLIVRQVIDTLTCVETSYRQFISGPIVTPSVGNTHNSRHHLI